MTQKTVKIYKNLPLKINCKADGFWDYNIIKSYNDNTTEQITMKTYDGFSYVLKNSDTNPNSFDFTTSLLPNYTYVDSQTAVLMPYDNGKVYHNTNVQEKNAYMDIEGCTITDDNQCTLTGGTSAVFNSSKIIPATATTVKMIFKMTLTNNSTSQIITRCNTGGKAAQSYVQSTGYYKGYFGGAVGGVTPLTANTTYWFGVLEDKSTIKGYLLADNGTYTLDTLPDFAQWSEEWSQNVTSPYTYKGCSIGFFKHADSQPWLGSIDLNNCKIWVDEEDFWYYNMITEVSQDLKGCLYNYTDTGSAATLNCFYYNNTYVLSSDNEITNGIYLGQIEIPAHDVYTYSETPYQVYDNFTIIGTGLDIDQETGKVSGFSSSSYLDTGYIPNLPANTPWKMRVRFKYSEVNSSQYYFSSESYASGPYIATDSSHHLNCGISSNGSQINSPVISTFVLEDGVNYSVEWVYDGDQTYTLRYKIEDGSWQDVGTITYDSPVIYPKNLRIGASTSNFCRGVIDLSTDTYFEIDGVKTWIPTTTHYNTTWTKQ